MPIDFTRVPSFYHKYIQLVQEENLTEAFQKHQLMALTTLMDIPDESWDFRYAEGKWSIREMVQHMIDTERIFAYRALRFSRNDQTPLPGFDENAYAANAPVAHRSKANLLDELSIVQKGSLQLFASFTPGQLQLSGVANGNEIYVEGIGFVIVGHTLHHRNVLLERYLPVMGM